MKYYYSLTVCLLITSMLTGCIYTVNNQENSMNTIPESTKNFHCTQDTFPNDSKGIENDDMNNEETTPETDYYDIESLLSEPPESNCEVYVNDKKLTSKYGAYMDHKNKYAILPVTAIFKDLGAKVRWESNVAATIEYNETVIRLDAVNKTVINQDNGTDYFRDPVGSTQGVYFGFTEDEFWLGTVGTSFMFLDTNVRANTDFTESVIKIKDKVPIPDDEKKTNCALMIDGIDLALEHFVYLDHTEYWCELPLVALVEAIGATVDWESETTAWIVYKDKIFYLDIEKNSLTDENGTKNLFEESAYRYNYDRNKGSYGIIQGEYVVDSNSIRLFLRQLDVIVSIDFTNSVVTVHKEGDGWYRA